MSRMTTKRARFSPRSNMRVFTTSAACVAVASAMFSASRALPRQSLKSETAGPSAIIEGTPRGASV